MKQSELYRLLVKSKLPSKSYYIYSIEKFQKNEILDENDFGKFVQFEFGDYICSTKHVIKFKSSWSEQSGIVDLPVFVHLRTYKPFVFRINFIHTNYFQKVDNDVEC